MYFDEGIPNWVGPQDEDSPHTRVAYGLLTAASPWWAYTRVGQLSHRAGPVGVYV